MAIATGSPKAIQRLLKGKKKRGTGRPFLPRRLDTPAKRDALSQKYLQTVETMQEWCETRDVNFRHAMIRAMRAMMRKEFDA